MTEITLDPTVVALIGGAVIPVLTGLLTKLDSSTNWKAGLALVLAVVIGVATTATESASFTVEQIIEAAGIAFAANVTTYIGAWKPLGKTEQVPLQNATANFGLGKAA
jgi:fucose permease